MKKFIKKLRKVFTIPRVSNCPSTSESVLALIEQIDSYGKMSWYEVVFYSDNHWQSYADSNTFENDEKVVKWRYCKDCIN